MRRLGSLLLCFLPGRIGLSCPLSLPSPTLLSSFSPLTYLFPARTTFPRTLTSDFLLCATCQNWVTWERVTFSSSVMRDEACQLRGVMVIPASKESAPGLERWKNYPPGTQANALERYSSLLQFLAAFIG